jgi:hypothetical protein
LKTKLKGSHVETIEVIEAESQTALNTLTEHNFQEAIKKWQNVENGAYGRKGTNSRVMVYSRPKYSF